MSLISKMFSLYSKKTETQKKDLENDEKIQKRKIASEKAAETRKRKKIEKEELQKQNEPVIKEEPIIEDNDIQVEEQEETHIQPEQIETIDQEQPPALLMKKDKVDEPTSKISKTFDDNSPPKWFTDYLRSVEKTKVSIDPDLRQKKIKEIKEEATEKWNNQNVRRAVNSHVDAHMEKMYKMMFNSKRLY